MVVSGAGSEMNLIQNLKTASSALIAIGEHQDMMSHYDSAADLGKFVARCIPEIENGTISKEDLKELTLVFAPTSEWDNYIDAIMLGEDIFQALLELEAKRAK